jgi:pimeloyl-ACP methyl ester carboxylesterase
VLAWAEFGDPEGTPLLYHHGWPGSRLEARFAHETALTLRLRIIAPDRPGYGASTQAPSRTLTDWAADAEQLTDHLRVDRFTVLGISGGAPYALACAAALPVRVIRVCLVSAMGQVDSETALGKFDPVRRASLRMARRRSPLMQGLLRGAVGPLIARHADRFVSSIARGSGPADRATLAQKAVQTQIAASFREGLRGGAGGAARDLELYASPWAIALKRIEAPVDLWHGEADAIIPAWLARELAGHLPTVTTRFLPGEGHYSVPLKHLETIMRAIAHP